MRDFKTGEFYTQKTEGNKLFVTGFDPSPFSAQIGSKYTKVVKDALPLNYVCESIERRDSKGIFKDEKLKVNSHFTATLVLMD